MDVPVARLPSALLRAISSFFAEPSDRNHYEVQMIRRGMRVVSDLQKIAQVSRDWNNAARDVASESTLRTLRHEVVHLPGTRAQLLELRRRVTLGRAFLKELYVTPPRGRSSRLFSRNHDWRSIAAHMPRLETLHLREMSRTSVVMTCVPIIDAVAALCPRLKTLQLPWVLGEDPEPARDTMVLLDTVVRCLQQWAPRGGLHKLRLPMPFTHLDKPHSHATRYLKAIAETCPQLESLDGYNAMILVLDDLVCAEQWHVDLATWEQFCSACSRLTSFSWIVAPFATSFFEVFGSYAKPQLTSLTFATPMDWNWECYHRHLPLLDRGVGAKAVNAHAALRACPALTNLDVQLYLPGDASRDPFHTGPPMNPGHLMLNKEIFGDDFCAAIARYCVNVERLTIWRFSEGTTQGITIANFTDAAMRSLATLPRLTWMQLTAVNITGDGLFVLCTHFAHGPTMRQRDYEITVGDTLATPYASKFYEVIEQFLGCLAEWDTCRPLPCSPQRVMLRFLNGCHTHVDREWSQFYLACLEPLLNVVRRKHPEMRLRFMTRGMTTRENGFDHVFEFNFYSFDAEICDEYEWRDANDTVIDSMFVDRSFEGRRFDDDQEEFDDGVDY